MKTYSIDDDTPLIPEMVAEDVSQDASEREALCARARHHWATHEGFRASFKRQDERDKLAQWMRHWMGDSRWQRIEAN